MGMLCDALQKQPALKHAEGAHLSRARINGRVGRGFANKLWNRLPGTVEHRASEHLLGRPRKHDTTYITSPEDFDPLRSAGLPWCRAVVVEGVRIILCGRIKQG